MGRPRDLAAERTLHFQRRCDMVGVNMGIERQSETQAEPAKLGHVAVH